MMGGRDRGIDVGRKGGIEEWRKGGEGMGGKGILNRWMKVCMEGRRDGGINGWTYTGL
jgi:hypothetical protein